MPYGGSRGTDFFYQMSHRFRYLEEKLLGSRNRVIR
jgi:hypothetical protein